MRKEVVTINSIQLVGNLARDPELRTTASGHSVCTFTIACQRPVKNASGEREADFIRCVAWRERGEFVSRYFNKGSKIAVEGSLQVRQYEAQDGTKRTIAEVIVSNVEFVERRQGGASEAPPVQGEFQEVPDDDLPF